MAGAIYWARSLKARIQLPMAKLLVVNRIVKERPEEFKEIDKLYNSMVGGCLGVVLPALILGII